MTRFRKALSAGFVFLLAALSFAEVAQAGPYWETKEVTWQFSSFDANGVVQIRDTTHASVAASVLDTTAWFTLDRLAVDPRASSGLADDSTSVAYLIFQADSSADFTANLTNITVQFDVGSRWSSQIPNNAIRRLYVSNAVVTPLAHLVTTGRKIVCVAIPLPQLHPTDSVANEGNLVQFMPLRARVTATTGVLTACRVGVAWLKEAGGR